jgi:hypothetical protein
MPGKTNRRGWGHIRRRPGGKFQASYIGPDLVRHCAPKTFTAKMDAEGWLRDERRTIRETLPSASRRWLGSLERRTIRDAPWC